MIIVHLRLCLFLKSFSVHSKGTKINFANCKQGLNVGNHAKAMFVSKCTHFAFSCSRAILAGVFRGISKDSVPMVTGNLLHQVIQGVLVKWAESHDNGDDIRRSVTREDVEEMIGSVLSSRENLNQLYATMEEYIHTCTVLWISDQHSTATHTHVQMCSLTLPCICWHASFCFPTLVPSLCLPLLCECISFLCPPPSHPL